MDISCCAWALSTPEKQALDQLASIGFEHIDVQAQTYTNSTSHVRLADLGLDIRCVGLSFNMPATAELDSPDAKTRQAALDHLTAGLDQAALYGVDTAYIVPGQDAALLDHFSESFTAAGELAATRHIKLCVEHFPGKALPTASGTLAYLRELDHPNLYLLIDSGHLQISNENPVQTIAAAGAQLGYVHLDDNDGKNDLHWALGDGVLTRDTLTDTLRALTTSTYTGPVSLELHPQLPDPKAALEQSLELVKALLA
jgi:sugar phosphate isomerase/epimerase